MCASTALLPLLLLPLLPLLLLLPQLLVLRDPAPVPHAHHQCVCLHVMYGHHRQAVLTG